MLWNFIADNFSLIVFVVSLAGILLFWRYASKKMNSFFEYGSSNPKTMAKAEKFYTFATYATWGLLAIFFAGSAAFVMKTIGSVLRQGELFAGIFALVALVAVGIVFLLDSIMAKFLEPKRVLSRQKIVNASRGYYWGRKDFYALMTGND